MFKRLFAVLCCAFVLHLTHAQFTPIQLDNLRSLQVIASYGMGAPRQFDISDDGTRFAAAMGRGGVRIYDTADFTTPLDILNIKDGDACDVDFSPDGSRIAFGDCRGLVAVFDATTFVHQYTLEAHTDSVLTVEFSPDSASLLSGSRDQTAKLWETATGQPIRTFTLDSWGDAIAFSPDGTRLVVANRGGHLFDVASGQRIAELVAHTDLITAAAFSPDGLTFVTAADDRAVKVWDSATGALRTTLLGFSAPPSAVLFDAQTPNHVLTSDQSGQLIRWDIPTAQPVNRATVRGGLLDMHRLSDGGILASSLDFGVVRLDADGQEVLTPTDLRTAITGMSLASDGRLAVGYASGEIDLVNPLIGTAETLIPRPDGAVIGVRDLAYTPDFAHLVVGYTDNSVRVYETDGYTLIAQTQTGKSFRGLVIDGQGARVGVYGVVTALYSLPDLSPLADVSFATSTNSLAFQPDGGRFAVGHRTENVHLFDGATYQPLGIVIRGPAKPEYNGSTGGITALSYTPDGTGLMISWNHATTGLYDPATGQPIQETFLDRDFAQVMVNAADNRYVVFLDFREMIFMRWDSQPVLKIPRTYEGGAIDGAFNRTGTRLYTLSEDSVIRLWGIVE